MTRFVLAAVLLALPIATLPDQSFQGSVPVTLGSTLGKTVVMKTAVLTTTATTADQVVLTYTVTSGKTLYLQYFDVTSRLTTYAATATNFGDCSLESPAGTKLWTEMQTNAGVSGMSGHQLAEPVPIASGVVVRLVCTPSAVTSFRWQGNLGGYER